MGVDAGRRHRVDEQREQRKRGGQHDAGVVRHSGVQIGQFYFDTWPRALGLSLVGFAVLFAVPWVARGFTTVDRLLVRGLLGPTRTSDRVDDLDMEHTGVFWHANGEVLPW